MRAVIQRVTKAQVDVAGKTIGAIGLGCLVLVGVEGDDTAEDVKYLAEKVVGLRIFEDDDGKMNLSIKEVDGQLLVVSQFTLYGDCRKGKRPSFIRAAAPDIGDQLYQDFVNQVRASGVPTETGQFRAMMDVTMTNHGPVTILVDSKKGF